MHPLEILQGYRLGGRRATVELQPTDVPGVHIDFDVLKLVNDVQEERVSAVILTGTAGDGKTYLAYRILKALKLERATVAKAQGQGGYDYNGVFIDLDLSAGSLTEARVRRLHQALSAPGRLTLVCANEGKLSELEERFRQAGWKIPQTPLRINLSQRALVGPKAWNKVLHGVLDAGFWAEAALPANDILSRNRAWLRDPVVTENVRRYLLLPYLLGEPITVREALSFLAYALAGELRSGQVVPDANDGIGRLPYLLFNTLFSEPGGYVHGGRGVPAEKLLWWLFRFDPGATAHPQTDLKLLIDLDHLDVTPPEELLAYWRTQTVVQPDEKSDTPYRQRVTRFMTYARRWYAIFSAEGQRAYFPFRYFDAYLDDLLTPTEELAGKILPTLLKGLNLLLSKGQIEEEFALNCYHTSGVESAQRAVIYSNKQIDSDQFQLVSDLTAEANETNATYLERHPRRLYLCYPAEAAPEAQIRLPISLLLYEVLRGVASPEGGFPATLWIKERYTVGRFLGALNRRVKSGAVIQFNIAPDAKRELKLVHDSKLRRIIVT